MKTSYRQQKEAREESVYKEYNRIINENPKAMKTAVEDHLMKKFKIHSRATIWSICQRVEKRLAQTAP